MNRSAFMMRMENRFGRYAIRNLMTYLIGGMAAVWLLDFLVGPVTGFSASRLLCFHREAILHGQIWRLFTYVFIPQGSGLLFLLFHLYFFWMIGTSLEAEWGEFRFNLFYFTGVILCSLAGMLTGYASTYYLNISLFLAFSLMYPDMQVYVLLFPVKVKWLALASALLTVVYLLTGSWAMRLTIVASMANLALFFWRDGWIRCQNAYRRYQWRKNWRR